MKEDWEKRKLGELCELYQPRTISAKEMVPDGEYDVFGANGKIGKYNHYNHENSEILMTCRGATCGNINLSTPKAWINGNAMVVHIKDESQINRSFLVYLLSYIDKRHIITGSAQPQITRQTLSPLVIFFPKITEQRFIVSRLDTAFAKIDELKANAEKQLNEARAFFQKALNEIMAPKEGWVEMKIGDCFKSINNGANIKQIKGAGGIPITRIETLSNDRFNRDRLGYADIMSTSRWRNYVLNENDILMSHINSMKFLGRAIVYKKEGSETIIHGMNLLRLVAYDFLSSKFACYYFYTDSFREQILSISHQSVNQASFNVTNFKGLKLYLPSNLEQQAIVSHMETLSAKVKKLDDIYQKTIAECDALKQALLKEIFE